MNRKLLVLLLGMLLPFSVVAKNEVNPADLVIKANEIYQRAKAACKSGDYDKALKEYEEAISAFGDAAKAYRKAKAKKDEDNIKERIKSVKEERDECKKKQKEAKKAAREKEKQARETEKKAKDTEKIPGDADQAAKEAAKRTAPGTAPGTDPNASIIVGPRELVGKPSLAEKAATGAMGGLVGSVLDAPSRTAEKPRTYRDPSRKLDYNNLAAGNFDTETRARGLWTKDGLLISSRIEESPGKGTFQTLFLESCDGRRLYPQRYEIYDLWNESSVSVSWSKTSTSNGQVISQESGGWDDSWSKEFSSIKPVAGEATTIPGTWQQLGFDRAQSGARQIGAYFKLTPQQLAGMGELGLFVHTTRPAQDPVTTVPAHWLLSPGNEKQPLLSAVIRPCASIFLPAVDISRTWPSHCPLHPSQPAAARPSQSMVIVPMSAGRPFQPEKICHRPAIGSWSRGR